MYKKVFSMVLLFIATVMLVFPQLGNTGESLNNITVNKNFQVVLTPPGDGFAVGTNDLALKISDSKGKAVTGAIISITPWMPGMGHGVMLRPSVKETGNGNYSAENVGFSMPGQWELIVTVNQKDIADRVTFEFANIVNKTQAGATAAKCNMKDGKCQGNCSCGCKEGKPCNMKDGKCVGGCGCGCQAGPTAFNCNCGTGGNCPPGCLCGCQAGATAAKCNMVDGKCQGDCSCGCKEGKPCNMVDGKCVGGCGCGCQSTGVVNCKCGAGCTKLLNCSCGPNCNCPKDGKGGCGCSIGCKPGCANGGACPLPKPLGT